VPQPSVSTSQAWQRLVAWSDHNKPIDRWPSAQLSIRKFEQPRPGSPRKSMRLGVKASFPNLQGKLGVSDVRSSGCRIVQVLAFSPNSTSPATGDDEPSLASVATHERESQARWAQGQGCEWSADCELDESDLEPSLGASENMHQGFWGRPGSGLRRSGGRSSDDEPSLSGVTVERGDDWDLEADLGSFDRMVAAHRGHQPRSGRRRERQR
jgi:hypothetical protein